MATHVKPLTIEDATIPKGSIWRKLPVASAAVGVVGLGLAFALTGDDSRQFWYSYVTALMFWLSVGLGALFFVLLHHGTRAGWSTVVRRIAENYMVTLPLLGVLALIAALFGAHDLFEWSHPEVVANDLMVQAKVGYLNEGFLTLRVVAWLVIWTALAVFLYRWSTRQDKTGEVGLSHRMRWVAPVGFIIFAFSTTFMAIDFMMSLDPHWYSTIFGVYYFGGTFMVAMAILGLSAIALQRSGMLKDHITPEHYHDIGKLAFAFMVFWSYAAFSQFMLIWYANVPEETIWFAHRLEGGWEWVTLLLALIHFAIPFFFLMSKHIKRRQTTFVVACVLLVVAHYVDIFWLVQPTMHQHHDPHFAMHGADIFAFLGIGGLVMAVFTWRLGAAPVAPVKDPRLQESLAFENY